MRDTHAMGTAFAAELTKNHMMMHTSEDQKVKAAAAWFDALHDYAAANLAMGASAEETDKFLKKAVKAVGHHFRSNPDECEQKYGIAPLALLLMLPSIWNFIMWIKERLFGEAE